MIMAFTEGSWSASLRVVLSLFIISRVNVL